MSRLTGSEKDALLLHVLFTVVCVLVLFCIQSIPIGVRLMMLVLLYNCLVPITAHLRGHDEWKKIWLFSLITSIFQVFPDWFLAAQLDILVFPEDGLFKIGSVSGYMAGLWAIPFFIIIFTSYRIRERYSETAGYLASAIIAFIIFTGSEQTMWMLQSWYAKNVTMIGRVALYIVLPEILLGLTAYACFLSIKGRRAVVMIPAGCAVMLFYIGTSSFSYFLVEKILK